jgi:hypothetical protein
VGKIVEFVTPSGHKPLSKYVPEAMRGQLLEWPRTADPLPPWPVVEWPQAKVGKEIANGDGCGN